MKRKLMMGGLLALLLVGLTATAQKKGKWINLFDGKTMKGWRVQHDRYSQCLDY
ncbi:DUF1080 domain-containing protein [Niabella defluvii]|nr:DUF1080 domain-containing protein [Niabella sp. I65]